MKYVSLILVLASLIGCQNANPSIIVESSNATDSTNQPEWLSKAVVYQVNLRQHTAQGTINSFREQLPSLKALGVNTLLLMPIQPIGIKNRQGSLGSNYAIRDYTAINPEFGSLTDFQRFVTAAHDAGFKVLLDWPAQQMATDAAWVEKHPDWFTASSTTKDVVTIRLDNPEARTAMIKALQYWVINAQVDGFRAYKSNDYSGEFWMEARTRLDTIRPLIYMGHTSKLNDSIYNLELNHLLYQKIAAMAKGEGENDLKKWLTTDTSTLFPIRVNYITNFEENTSGNDVIQTSQHNHKPFFVMASTLPHSVPMLYSGQEFGLKRALKPFDKDTIFANDTSMYIFYQKVLQLNQSHPALDATKHIKLTWLNTHPVSESSNKFMAYSLHKDGTSVLVLLNFSETVTSFSVSDSLASKDWYNVMTDKPILPGNNNLYSVPAHDFLLLTTNE
jgi:glycosidase